MNSIKKHTRDLIFLSQLFVLQEYGIKDIKLTSPLLVNFFQRKGPSKLESKNIQTFNPSLTPKPSLTPSYQANLQPPTQAFSAPPKIPLTNTTSIPPTLNKPTKPIETSLSKTTSIPMNSQPMSLIKSSHPHSKEITLEPLNSPAAPRNFQQFWKILPNLLPDIPLLETIPNDALAHKINNTWMQEHLLTPIIILSFDEHEKNLKFLKNIARAISLHLAPARVLSAIKLEKENGWNSILTSSSIQLIIAADYGLYLQPELMKTYRENSQKRKYFLNHIPLLLLSDLSLYLKEPTLKSLLWRAICNEFAASYHASTHS